MTDLHSYGTFLNEKAEQRIAVRRRRRTRPLTPIDPASWMASIPDATPLSNLTIPGTHDSAAYAVMWPFVTTQTLSIAEQLNYGVRYFDFRCGLRNNVLEMVHGRALLGRTLADCLSSIYTWLDSHLSEALIIQIKPDRHPEESTLSFQDAIFNLLRPSAAKWRFAPTTPTLSQLRGKIQLLRRFPGPPYAGIPVANWADNPAEPFTIHTFSGLEITIQDHYNPASPQRPADFVARKEADVVRLLERAAADKKGNDKWYLNFCSAYEFNLYYQASPHDVAVGGWWYYVFTEGINPRLMEYLKTKRGRRRRYGIVVLDFPEQPAKELVAELVASNFGRAGERFDVSARAVLLMAVLLLVIFVAGTLLVVIHGPAQGDFCPPFLHACYSNERGVLA